MPSQSGFRPLPSKAFRRIFWCAVSPSLPAYHLIAGTVGN